MIYKKIDITNIINKAVNNLKNNKLVIFPTETVYGMGADAKNSQAISKIYSIKKRPINNPLIIHSHSIEMLQKITYWTKEAEILSKLWPGPLTIILNKQNNTNISISSNATAELNTIAVRIPSDPLALLLLQKFNGYIAAPSANPSGYISPTHYEHTLKHYSNNKDIYVIKANNSAIGVESTVIDLTQETPVILREGAITIDKIKKIINVSKSYNNLKNIKSPGMEYKHYAPKVKLEINVKKFNSNSINICFGKNIKYSHMNLSINGNLEEAAKNLYHYLHIAEEIAIKENKTICIAPIPNQDIGVAINDRLNRASISSKHK